MSRTAAEIERDIEEERLQLTRSLDALQDRFSVDTIVEQIKAYAIAGGGDAGRTAMRTARDNPVAVALTSIGAAWLAVGAGRSAPPEIPARSEVHPDRDALTPDPSDGFRRVPVYDVDGTAPASTVGRDDYDLPPRQSGAAYLGASRSRVTDAEYDLDTGTDGLDDEGRSRVRAARARALEARDTAADYMSEKASDLSDFIQRQPLIVGALALVLGAAVGGRAPGSRVENRLMGEQSDRLFVEAERVFEEERARARLHAEALKADAKAAMDDA